MVALLRALRPIPVDGAREAVLTAWPYKQRSYKQWPSISSASCPPCLDGRWAYVYMSMYMYLFEVL